MLQAQFAVALPQLPQAAVFHLLFAEFGQGLHAPHCSRYTPPMASAYCVRERKLPILALLLRGEMAFCGRGGSFMLDFAQTIRYIAH